MALKIMEKINKSNSELECPIFLKHKEKIEGLTQSIREANIISDEIDKAIELLSILTKLKNCGKYEEENDNCKNCHFILNLRKEMADTIVKANGTEAS